jgi:hypothetical protein
MEEVIKPLPEPVRQNLFLINLSTPTNRDNALLAGLDRANGDYSCILEFEFTNQPNLLTEMWEACQSGADMVYLKGPSSNYPIGSKFLHHAFHRIMKHYSGLKIDPHAHQSRMISRRALNSLLKLRENSHYLKALYALIGYQTRAVNVSQTAATDRPLGEQIRESLVVISSFTTFLRSVLLWIFAASVLVAGITILNAVKVKFTRVDLFGDYHQTLSGWAFLVVLISVFFAITCLNLYIMSIYLSNIYTELKNRPPYIIESVKRY